MGRVVLIVGMALLVIVLGALVMYAIEFPELGPGETLALVALIEVAVFVAAIGLVVWLVRRRRHSR